MSTFGDEVMAAAERSLPQVEGELKVGGLRGSVEVLRDTWGVPHIYAASLDDLYFAQGFVAATERLFQIDFQFRLATGRLSTMFGEPALAMDTFARTVGWNRAGRRIAREFWDERSHEITRAWWAGVLAAADQMSSTPPAEYAALGGLEPDLPPLDRAADELASAAVLMSWWLCGNADTELLRLQIGERLGERAVDVLLPRSGSSGLGSNNWVVAGSRTTTGKPLLANDPHLSLSMPSIWFECHLSAPGFDVSGVSLPFAPGVAIGRTPSIAWGVTNVGGDTQDLYLERLNDDRTAASFRGEWEPLQTYEERIFIRGHEQPAVVIAKQTRHGPLLDSTMIGIARPAIVETEPSEPIALQWIGFREATPPSTLEHLAQARTFGEFREAVRSWVCPGQNFVYADTGGHIGHQCTGSYPVRAVAHDGTRPVPGWTGEHEWVGTIPFDELPSIQDPEEGFLATANEQPHDDDYPHLIGTDFGPSFRARRIRELILAEPSHTPETFGRMHMDTVSISARELVPLLLASCEPHDARQKEAVGLLSDWDFDVSKGSAAAAVYEVWGDRIARRMLQNSLGTPLFDRFYDHRQGSNTFTVEILPALLHEDAAFAWLGEETEAIRDILGEALDDALEFLDRTLGDEIGAWRWGALHRVTFAPRLAIIPELAEPLSAGPVEIGGDGQTVLAASFEPGAGFDAVIVPSWRQIIDLGDLDGSIGMNTTGQSGNPASPHYRDLTGPWSEGEYHPMPFTRAAIEAATVSHLQLMPAGD